MIALMTGVFMIAFFFVRLYMQYQWTDKLVIAIQTEDEQKVDELLAQRFCGQPYDVDKKAHQPFPLSLFGELEREIPLQYACEIGNYEIIYSLVQCGADVNKTLYGHFSPLETAIMSFDYTERWKELYQVIELLIKNGADVDYITSHNESMYELCAQSIVRNDEQEKQILNIYKLLCQSGKNGKKYTDKVLVIAQEYDNRLLVEYLLSHNKE